MGFALAVLAIVVWLVTGPLFGFSDTWQLVINTGTTIVTFLMVFLIQRAQNKDSQAIQLKLNELVAAVQRRQQPADQRRGPDEDELQRCTRTTASWSRWPSATWTCGVALGRGGRGRHRRKKHEQLPPQT